MRNSKKKPARDHILTMVQSMKTDAGSYVYQIMIDKSKHKDYIEITFGKGIAEMDLFATKNSYNFNQAMLNHKHGLRVVFEYFSYEEK